MFSFVDVPVCCAHVAVFLLLLIVTSCFVGANCTSLLSLLLRITLAFTIPFSVSPVKGFLQPFLFLFYV